MADSNTNARNARLNALSAALKTWAATQTTAINNRVASSQSILQGRTGSNGLAQSSVQAASSLVAQSITDFLSST